MAPWDSRMRWQLGGNFQPIRFICKLSWKECPFAIGNYFWTELFTDVIEFFTNNNEGVLLKIILLIFISSIIISMIRWKNKKRNEKSANKDILNRMSFDLQELEQKIQILTYKIQYGTWPSLQQIANLHRKNQQIKKSLRLTISDTDTIQNYQNRWLQKFLKDNYESFKSFTKFSKISSKTSIYLQQSLSTILPIKLQKKDSDKNKDQNIDNTEIVDNYPCKKENSKKVHENIISNDKSYKKTSKINNNSNENKDEDQKRDFNKNKDEKDCLKDIKINQDNEEFYNNQDDKDNKDNNNKNPIKGLKNCEEDTENSKNHQKDVKEVENKQDNHPERHTNISSNCKVCNLSNEAKYPSQDSDVLEKKSSLILTSEDCKYFKDHFISRTFEEQHKTTSEKNQGSCESDVLLRSLNTNKLATISQKLDFMEDKSRKMDKGRRTSLEDVQKRLEILQSVLKIYETAQDNECELNEEEILKTTDNKVLARAFIADLSDFSVKSESETDEGHFKKSQMDKKQYLRTHYPVHDPGNPVYDQKSCDKNLSRFNKQDSTVINKCKADKDQKSFKQDPIGSNKKGPTVKMNLKDKSDAVESNEIENNEKNEMKGHLMQDGLSKDNKCSQLNIQRNPDSLGPLGTEGRSLKDQNSNPIKSKQNLKNMHGNLMKNEDSCSKIQDKKDHDKLSDDFNHFFVNNKSLYQSNLSDIVSESDQIDDNEGNDENYGKNLFLIGNYENFKEEDNDDGEQNNNDDEQDNDYNDDDNNYNQKDNNTNRKDNNGNEDNSPENDENFNEMDINEDPLILWTTSINNLSGKNIKNHKQNRKRTNNDVANFFGKKFEENNEKFVDEPHSSLLLEKEDAGGSLDYCKDYMDKECKNNKGHLNVQDSLKEIFVNNHNFSAVDNDLIDLNFAEVLQKNQKDDKDNENIEYYFNDNLKDHDDDTNNLIDNFDELISSIGTFTKIKGKKDEKDNKYGEENYGNCSKDQDNDKNIINNFEDLISNFEKSNKKKKDENLADLNVNIFSKMDNNNLDPLIISNEKTIIKESMEKEIEDNFNHNNKDINVIELLPIDPYIAQQDSQDNLQGHEQINQLTDTFTSFHCDENIHFTDPIYRNHCIDQKMDFNEAKDESPESVLNKLNKILKNNNCENLSEIECELDPEMSDSSKIESEECSSINISSENSSLYLTVDESLSDMSSNGKLKSCSSLYNLQNTEITKINNRKSGAEIVVKKIHKIKRISKDENQDDNEEEKIAIISKDSAFYETPQRSMTVIINNNDDNYIIKDNKDQNTEFNTSHRSSDSLSISSNNDFLKKDEVPVKRHSCISVLTDSKKPLQRMHANSTNLNVNTHNCAKKELKGSKLNYTENKPNNYNKLTTMKNNSKSNLKDLNKNLSFKAKSNLNLSKDSDQDNRKKGLQQRSKSYITPRKIENGGGNEKNSSIINSPYKFPYKDPGSNKYPLSDQNNGFKGKLESQSLDKIQKSNIPLLKSRIESLKHENIALNPRKRPCSAESFKGCCKRSQIKHQKDIKKKCNVHYNKSKSKNIKNPENNPLSTDPCKGHEIFPPGFEECEKCKELIDNDNDDDEENEYIEEIDLEKLSKDPQILSQGRKVLYMKIEANGKNYITKIVDPDLLMKYVNHKDFKDLQGMDIQGFLKDNKNSNRFDSEIGHEATKILTALSYTDTDNVENLNNLALYHEGAENILPNPLIIDSKSAGSQEVNK